jgi:hypothetical protein
MIRDGIERHASGPIDEFIVLIDFNLAKLTRKPEKRGTAACNRDLSYLNSTFFAMVGRAVRTLLRPS